MRNSELELTFSRNESSFIDQETLGRGSLLVVGDSEVRRRLGFRSVSESRQGCQRDPVEFLLVLRASSELDSLQETGVGARGGPLVNGVDSGNHCMDFCMCMMNKRPWIRIAHLCSYTEQTLALPPCGSVRSTMRDQLRDLSPIRAAYDVFGSILAIMLKITTPGLHFRHFRR